MPAPYRGCLAVIQLDGTAVAEVRSINYTATSRTDDASIAGTCARRTVVLDTLTTGTIGCLWEKFGDTTGQLAMINAQKNDTSHTLTYMPEGVGSGKPQIEWTGAKFVSSGGAFDVGTLTTSNFGFEAEGVGTPTNQT